MEAKHSDMEWQVMDVRKMQFTDASIDIAIDKATLDAMLYGSLWDPEDEVKQNVKAYVDEVCINSFVPIYSAPDLTFLFVKVARVLKPGGMWLYITWRQPHFIRPLLSRPDVWSLEAETLAYGGGMFEYYGFIMEKML